ncbi:TetR/AcrR family transcriptional regulator [Rhodococcus sp. WS4]|nr:TetR/AcrR family transcriptional regulator [Rhodococcus sp. WS4]
MSDFAKRRAAAAATAENNPAYQERVKEIRRAAGKVFHERGFRGTKVQDIAAATGVDRATLYYYIGSKEELFREAVSEAVSANIAAAEAIARQDLGAADKLARMIQTLMASYEEFYPYLYVFMQEDVDKLESGKFADQDWIKTVKDWNYRYFKLVRTTISDGIADGTFRTPLPPGVVANCVIGMLNSSHQWFRPGGLLDADEIGEGISQLILAGISPSP